MMQLAYSTAQAKSVAILKSGPVCNSNDILQSFRTRASLLDEF